MIVAFVLGASVFCLSSYAEDSTPWEEDRKSFEKIAREDSSDHVISFSLLGAGGLGFVYEYHPVSALSLGVSVSPCCDDWISAALIGRVFFSTTLGWRGYVSGAVTTEVLKELPQAPISVLLFGLEYRDTFVFRAGIGTANINDAKDNF